MRARLSAVAWWLPKLIARIPVTIHLKLLAGMLIIVTLFVAVGFVGLTALGEANDTADELGKLDARVAAFKSLQAGVNRDMAAAASALSATDPETVEFSGRQLGQSSYDLDRVLYVAPGDGAAAGEAELMDLVERDGKRLVETLLAIVALVEEANRAEGPIGERYRREATQLMETEAATLVRDLERYTGALVLRAQSDVVTTIDDNDEDYVASRNLFLALSAASVVVALGLGYAISWSVIGPVRQMDAQLAKVASGDFSSHVAVENRDELGALAANLNQMNDELGRLYLELEAASRHKSEFLANMSHELRTPLNAIIGFSEMLQERMAGDLNEKQDEYVADIVSSGKHLLSLINDILDLSKVEAGRMDLDLSEFSLANTLENGVAMVRERAARRAVALTLDVSPDVNVIEADERKVKQVIYNLLTNAVKFTPAGGRVEVRAQVLDGFVAVSVRDTGIGIAPEDQAHIFEEFSQLARPESVEQEGTGLGLALARKFVELQGGRINVESDLGRGSTFSFTLPLRDSPGTAEVGAPGLGSPAPESADRAPGATVNLKEAPDGG